MNYTYTPWSGELIDEGSSIFCCEYWLVLLGQFEDGIDHRELGGCRVLSAESTPIIGDHACSDHITTSINSSCAHWHLEKCWEFIEFSNTAHWVYHGSIICNGWIRTDQCISRDSCSVSLHSQHVLNYLLSIFVKLWMDQCHVVVTSDTVAKGA